MAHQDYVARPRASKNKKSPYKKEEIKASGIPLKLKVIILFTILALAGFSYMLWTLNDVEVVEQTQQVIEKPDTKKVDLPEPYTEKWDYMDDLKDKQVEEGQYTVEDRGPFKMQCGAFRTNKQAEKMRANLAFLGLEAHIKKSTGKNGTWHQVYLGPYARKRAAEKDKHRINSNNIANSCDIWLWR